MSVLRDFNVYCKRFHSTQEFVRAALVGAPNAGKSTLLNALVGKKVSAVSNKTNTTQQTREGQVMYESANIIIHDTPGIVKPTDYLNQKHGDRVESAWSIASDADAALLVVDAYRQFHKPDCRIVELIQDFKENLVKLQQRDRRIALVMTKMDQIAKDSARNVTEMIENLSYLAGVDSTFAVSALRGKGLKEVADFLARSPRNSYMGTTTVKKEEGINSIVSEIVREKVFRAYYKEVPYAVGMQVKSIKEEQNLISVRVNLYVPTDRMKMIVIGKKGSAISSVELASKVELSKLLGKEIRMVIGVCLDER
eukprot:jgi/Picsp_1/5748/NSC_03107-R1_gtp-binding protein era